MNEAKHCCPTYHVELGAQVCAKRYRNANADYRQGQGFRPGHDDFACRDCEIGRRLYEVGLAEKPEKGENMITVTLEDQGQDFLEWDIENGVVVGCRPFQERVWNGVRVLNEMIEPGDVLWIWLKGEKNPTTLNYRVEEVQPTSKRTGSL